MSLSRAQPSASLAALSGRYDVRWRKGEATFSRIIDKAFDAGVNFIDTADVYHAVFVLHAFQK